jgi:hypothetical protein
MRDKWAEVDARRSTGQTPNKIFGRSDFAGWLAEDGGIPRFASATDGWKQRRLGTKFIRNQNRNLELAHRDVRPKGLGRAGRSPRL